MGNTTGTFYPRARAITDGWPAVSPWGHYRKPAADYHRRNTYVAYLRDEVAAGDITTGDTFTWAMATMRGTEEIVGVYLIYPRDLALDASNYVTWTIELDGNAVCSRSDANGMCAGEAYEITRTGSLANRTGSRGEAIEVIATVTVGGTSVALPAGIIVVVVTTSS